MRKILSPRGPAIPTSLARAAAPLSRPPADAARTAIEPAGAATRCPVQRPVSEGCRMAVISLLNQKGGVGKSTMTSNLGGTLARRGRRVLVVDNDPQSSLSQGLLGPEETMALPVGA